MNIGHERYGSENDGESSSSSDNYDTAKSHEKSCKSFQALPSSSSTNVTFVGVAKFQPINPSEMDLDVASSVTLQSDGKELRDRKPVKYLQWPWSNGGGMKRERYESDEESRSTFKQRSKRLEKKDWQRGVKRTFSETLDAKRGIIEGILARDGYDDDDVETTETDNDVQTTKNNTRSRMG